MSSITSAAQPKDRIPSFVPRIRSYLVFSVSTILMPVILLHHRFQTGSQEPP
ncbi:hypothetical protein SISNIDRAFT_461536 [Sistotremastrum niveocremeum HHB9708]|uniref:Uncharacterized protein n=1 Tax=Sistotremastrum niveocremeum HHB9708 TaxID=1314777 RepID=A0A164MIM0_9AGAM|nr:hypothetical protein SISNIDRAFT_461536 [Sistotremastrum niveocremeum HHB9708]